MADGDWLSSEGDKPAATAALSPAVSIAPRARTADPKAGSALPILPRRDGSGDVKSPLHRPWTLPAQGLAVFHGGGNTARLSHYFLPRLLLQGKRVLLLDGANCADPRLIERLARQRGVPFEQCSRQIQIARAFTCFQLTELIARVPRFLADFPAEVLIVTAFPELYFDEDVRDWDARVAFEQGLAGLRRLAGRSEGRDFSPAAKRPLTPAPLPQGEGRVVCLDRCPLPPGEGGPPGADRVRGVSPAALPLAVAVFSSASTFIPSPARQRFFEKTCAEAAEVWKFSVGESNRLELACERRKLLQCVTESLNQ